jgi:hypothetical protein
LLVESVAVKRRCQQFQKVAYPWAPRQTVEKNCGA